MKRLCCLLMNRKYSFSWSLKLHLTNSEKNVCETKSKDSHFILLSHIGFFLNSSQWEVSILSSGILKEEVPWSFRASQLQVQQTTPSPAVGNDNIDFRKCFYVYTIWPGLNWVIFQDSGASERTGCPWMMGIPSLLPSSGLALPSWAALQEQGQKL